jgi:hypothetical protein
MNNDKGTQAAAPEWVLGEGTWPNTLADGYGYEIDEVDMTPNGAYVHDAHPRHLDDPLLVRRFEAKRWTSTSGGMDLDYLGWFKTLAEAKAAVEERRAQSAS